MTNLFRRVALSDLQAWSTSSTRKPLVIRGARQVGKTSLVRLFAKSYSRYAELNLEKPTHAALFRQKLSPAEVVQAIQLECGTPPGSDPLLVFLDEIQEVPEAVAMLRFLYEEYPDIHVVAAGSLLELALSAEAISFPVGRVQYLYIHPLSFQEFLHIQQDDAALHALEQVPVPDYAHDHLLRQFHTYALVGGMPEAVAAYSAAGNDILAANQVYADLFSAFRDDILKYGRNETMRRLLLHGLDTAPFSAGSRIHFHGFGGSSYRSREMGEALRTLEQALLIELVYPTVQTAEPLTPDHNKAPRLHFLDTGLVNHRAGIQRHLIGVQDLTSIYRGRLIEQVIGQELKTMETRTLMPLRFWVRDKAQSQAEVDFLFTTTDGIVPIEGKSGTAGKLRSLHQYMGQSGGKIAIRLYPGKPAIDSIRHELCEYTLVSVPYYAISRITQYIEWAKGNDHKTHT